MGESSEQDGCRMKRGHRLGALHVHPFPLLERECSEEEAYVDKIERLVPRLILRNVVDFEDAV